MYLLYLETSGVVAAVSTQDKSKWHERITYTIGSARSEMTSKIAQTTELLLIRFLEISNDDIDTVN